MSKLSPEVRLSLLATDKLIGIVEHEETPAGCALGGGGRTAHGSLGLLPSSASILLARRVSKNNVDGSLLERLSKLANCQSWVDGSGDETCYLCSKDKDGVHGVVRRDNTNTLARLEAKLVPKGPCQAACFADDLTMSASTQVPFNISQMVTVAIRNRKPKGVNRLKSNRHGRDRIDRVRIGAKKSRVQSKGAVSRLCVGRIFRKMSKRIEVSMQINASRWGATPKCGAQ